MRLSLLKTLYRLGLSNIIRVLWYRVISLKFLGRVLFPIDPILEYLPDQTIFLPSSKRRNADTDRADSVIEAAEEILKDGILLYSYFRTNRANPPNWFYDCINEKYHPNISDHWTKLPDFIPDTGDIKNIWEISRFNWLLVFAAAYSLSKSEKYLITMNNWVADWVRNNPPNVGPNWKCGQETSLRAINIIVAFELMGCEKLTPALLQFLRIHLARIRPTLSYAKSQDNNHGISEAIAMLMISAFLIRTTGEKKYTSSLNVGYRLLENRVSHLILDDGSFSQHSMVYHRMILDLLSIVEIFRRRWQLKLFSMTYYSKIELAIVWASSIVDHVSGDAPNLGANDGTQLFRICNDSYRDFCPSLTLASSVFKVNIATALVDQHILLDLFGLSIRKGVKRRAERSLFESGGYAKISRENGFALLRLPIYTFRPSHSDALHVDIWQDGINWIRDTGTYSYAAPIDVQENYAGTAGHSTIQFDNRNQMPRISRFLFGSWLKPTEVLFNAKNSQVSAAYTDFMGARHRRQIKKLPNGWQIVDEIAGNFSSATQRWILAPGAWTLDTYTIKNDYVSISIHSDDIGKIEMKEGHESVYYMESREVVVLEVDFDLATTIKTNVVFIK
jgi:hypothetical protein